MSELPPETSGRDGVHVPPPPPEEMPRWVPVLIGVVLVALAALAIITGLRYRENTLVNIVESRRTLQRNPSAAPPGEPEAGGSLVIPDGAPRANEPVEGAARAEITGGVGGVSAVMRLNARRGMMIKAVPPDALVYVNDVAVGQASQFDSDDEVYDFAQPGSYDVTLRAPGFKDRRFVVTASDESPNELARIEARLDKQ